MMLATCCLLIALSMASPAVATDEQDYPLRPFYPAVRTIDTDRFLEIYFDALVIDVRSKFAFDIIHINKAKHVPLAQANFVASIKRYRAQDSNTPIVFYCNDAACSSAFRAAQLTQGAAYGNVYVYDTGVFTLLTAAPEKVTLMATTPAQPDLVIPSDYYNKVRVDFDEFQKRSDRTGALVIDIRDIFDRAYEPRLAGVRNIPVEPFLTAVTNRIWLEKKLLIFDQNGEKTRWLQYFLQANGYSDYVFLHGGMDGLDLTTQARKIIRSNSRISLDQQRLFELTMDSTLNPLDIRMMNLLAASIGFENHAVVNSNQILESLHCTGEQFKTSVERLRRGGYLLFGDMGNVLVFHINPRLAWKGKMSGALWAERISEFDASTGREGGVL